MIPVTEYPAEEIERVFSEETSRSVVKMTARLFVREREKMRLFPPSNRW